MTQVLCYTISPDELRHYHCRLHPSILLSLGRHHRQVTHESHRHLPDLDYDQPLLLRHLQRRSALLAYEIPRACESTSYHLEMDS